MFDDLLSYLSAVQLGDSAFPSGRYTLSYGLEAVAQSGQLTTQETVPTLSRLLSDCIRFGVAPSDGVALACAHRALGPDGSFDWDVVTRADQRLTKVKLAREARNTSMRTGRALLATTTTVIGAAAICDYAQRVRNGWTPGNHAIVLGLVSAALGVPRLAAVAGELYAFCASWVAAAVRLSLIDHRAAQHMLHQVRPVTAEAARNAVDRDVAQISSCTPFVDVMSMRHEQAELRLFAS
jgi:urease accessory protein